MARRPDDSDEAAGRRVRAGFLVGRLVFFFLELVLRFFLATAVPGAGSSKRDGVYRGAVFWAQPQVWEWAARIQWLAWALG